MSAKDPIDAVTRYLFEHRQDLLTDDERRASLVAVWLEKADLSDGASGNALRRMADRKRTLQTDLLIGDDYRAFRTRVRERILHQHGDAVLNRCPRCNGLCHTPRAKQCPHCFHDWHS